MDYIICRNHQQVSRWLLDEHPDAPLRTWSRNVCILPTSRIDTTDKLRGKQFDGEVDRVFHIGEWYEGRHYDKIYDLLRFIGWDGEQ